MPTIYSLSAMQQRPKVQQRAQSHNTRFGCCDPITGAAAAIGGLVFGSHALAVCAGLPVLGIGIVALVKLFSKAKAYMESQRTPEEPDAPVAK